MVAQGLVVAPQGQRISILLGGRGVDEFERSAFVVGVFLEDPRLDAAAAIGKHNAVHAVFNHGLGFGRRVQRRS